MFCFVSTGARKVLSLLKTLLWQNSSPAETTQVGADWSFQRRLALASCLLLYSSTVSSSTTTESSRLWFTWYGTHVIIAASAGCVANRVLSADSQGCAFAALPRSALSSPWSLLQAAQLSKYALRVELTATTLRYKYPLQW